MNYLDNLVIRLLIMQYNITLLFTWKSNYKIYCVKELCSNCTNKGDAHVFVDSSGCWHLFQISIEVTLFLIGTASHSIEEKCNQFLFFQIKPFSPKKCQKLDQLSILIVFIWFIFIHVKVICKIFILIRARFFLH